VAGTYWVTDSLVADSGFARRGEEAGTMLISPVRYKAGSKLRICCPRASPRRS
jgi:hypothetical protein